MFFTIACTSWSWWCKQKDEITRSLLTLSIAVIAISWYVWTSKKLRNKSPPLPPGPRGLPLVGYLPFLGTELHREFSELARAYGPIMKLRLGNRLCVVLSSWSVAKEVLRDHDAIFANPDPTVAAYILTYDTNDIAWSPYGEDWRMLRKICVREVLSNGNLDACYVLRRREVRKMVRDVYTKIGHEPVKFSNLMFLTSLDIVTSMIWGGTLKDEECIGRLEFRKIIEELMQLIGEPNFSDFFPILTKLDIQSVGRRSKKNFALVDQMFDSIIDRREKEDSVEEGGLIKSKESKDFLQIILDFNKQKETKTRITRTQLKAMFVDLITGGTDTTTTTIKWMMAELMRQPKIMRRVQQELEEVVGMNNIVEESHLPKLHYLKANVKETLRLHPVLPLLVPRRPSATCTVGGYTIPKGTKVMLNVWEIQRDPQIWDNPLEFQPERFTGDNILSGDYTGKTFHYIPFGSGRRMCPGLFMAERMLMYVAASLLHSFDWQLLEGTELDFSDKFGFVLRKLKPLIVIPTPRLSSLELYA